MEFKGTVIKELPTLDFIRRDTCLIMCLVKAFCHLQTLCVVKSIINYLLTVFWLL
jgi:hypothetical protein